MLMCHEHLLAITMRDTRTWRKLIDRVIQRACVHRRDHSKTAGWMVLPKPVLRCEERTPKRPEVHSTSGCPVMLVKGPKRVGPRYGCAAARRLAEEVGQWKEEDVAVQLRVALQHGVETAPSRLILGSIAALQCVRREAGWQTVGRTLLELGPIADEKQLRLLRIRRRLRSLVAALPKL